MGINNHSKFLARAEGETTDAIKDVLLLFNINRYFMYVNLVQIVFER